MDLSSFTTEDIVRTVLQDHGHTAGDHAALNNALIERWRREIDIGVLVKLLRSEVTRERTKGAYFLGEALPLQDNIIKAAIVISNDAVSYCRLMFLVYAADSGVFNREIAESLKNRFFDPDLYVRAQAINWLICASSERFEMLQILVNSADISEASGKLSGYESKRGVRALEIARRLRSGENVSDIRKIVLEEDSLTFDYFERFKERTRRYNEKRSRV